MHKAAIFVDVQNIYYTTKQTFSRSFNYRHFWHSIAKDYDIVEAIAFAIDKGDEQQMKFQSALKHIGFEVKLKPFIQRADGSAKGDWDVGITIDIMEAAAEVDTVILLSGDGDFDLLVDKLRQAHKASVEVYGVPKFTSTSLINSASKYMPIDKDLLLGGLKR